MSKQKQTAANEAESKRKVSREVDCRGEQYIYAGTVYGPGVVEIEDEEIADIVESAVERVEKKNAEEMERVLATSSGLAPDQQGSSMPPLDASPELLGRMGVDPNKHPENAANYRPDNEESGNTETDNE